MTDTSEDQARRTFRIEDELSDWLNDFFFQCRAMNHPATPHYLRNAFNWAQQGPIL